MLAIVTMKNINRTVRRFGRVAVRQADDLHFGTLAAYDSRGLTILPMTSWQMRRATLLPKARRLRRF